MSKELQQTLTLDEECISFLRNYKRKNKVPKSVLVRQILKYHIKNPDTLETIIRGEY
ncbi:MAG: hypothetical protein ACFFKA_13110 [Candidatus Thorarchaeota archaeon]